MNIVNFAIDACIDPPAFAAGTAPIDEQRLGAQSKDGMSPKAWYSSTLRPKMFRHFPPFPPTPQAGY
jgi:hypothetical protein